MSGEKDTYVNLRTSEYNRMMKTCRRMDNVEGNIKSNMDRMAGNLRQDFETRISAVNRRHENLEIGMAGLSSEMHRVEAEQNRRISEHAREFQRGLNALGSEMTFQRQEYTRMIQDQEQRFGRALNEQRRELEGRIQSIQDALVQKEISERDQAGQWLSDARTFIDTIGSEYRHEKFAPGALEKIRAELSLTQGNYDNRNYQAAIASAQQSYIRASELRLELERMEMEWEAHLEAARHNAAEVLAALDAQEICRFTFETEDGAKELAGEVDFWTKGGLTDLRTQVKNEINRLSVPDNMILDELKQAIEQSAQWSRESLELSEQAKEAILASQLRNNIGQAIENALIDSGWEITDAAYEGEDFRGAVHVKLQSLAGDEIVSVITPETGEDQSIKNKVSISFFDRSTNDENFRKDRLAAITDVLNDEGLDVSKPVCRKGTENQPSRDEQKLDFTQVRKMTGQH